MTRLVIKRVESKADHDAWHRVPTRVFDGDALYVPPLLMDERRRIARRGNPFFQTADVEFFVAVDGSEPVGRISAQVNRRYLDRHADGTGQFGFLETIDDRTVSTALIEAAADWLAARGMRRMEGPFNLSVNDECGLLVDGFDTPSAMMMPQARRWQSGHLESAGFASVAELYAYRVNPFAFPEQIEWLSQGALSNQRISVRSFERSRYDEEIELMVDIFNDAWRDNWGFVPMDVEELKYMMAPLRPFFRGHYGKFVCFDGEPVGFAVVLPNINEIIAPFGGRLLPLNWWRLGLAMLLKRHNTARMPLLGLRHAHQGGIHAAQLFATMLAEHRRDLQPYLDGVVARHDRQDRCWIELSWVLASNRPLNSFLRSIVGDPAKTYRIYGKQIA